MTRPGRFFGTAFGVAVLACLVLAGWALWSGGILDGPIARQVRAGSIYAEPGVGLDQAAAERIIGNRRLVVVFLNPGDDLRAGCDSVDQAADGTLVLMLSKKATEFDKYGCAKLPDVDDENFGKAFVAETKIATGVDQFVNQPLEALKVVAVNYDLLVRSGAVPDGARTVSPSLPRFLVAGAAVAAVIGGASGLYFSARGGRARRGGQAAGAGRRHRRPQPARRRGGGTGAADHRAGPALRQGGQTRCRAPAFRLALPADRRGLHRGAHRARGGELEGPRQADRTAAHAEPALPGAGRIRLSTPAPSTVDIMSTVDDVEVWLLGRVGRAVDRAGELVLVEQREHAEESLVGDRAPVVGLGDLGLPVAGGLQLPGEHVAGGLHVADLVGVTVDRVQRGSPADHPVRLEGDHLVAHLVVTQRVVVHLHHELVTDAVDLVGGTLDAAQHARPVELGVPGRGGEQAEELLRAGVHRAGGLNFLAHNDPLEKGLGSTASPVRSCPLKAQVAGRPTSAFFRANSPVRVNLKPGEGGTMVHPWQPAGYVPRPPSSATAVAAAVLALITGGFDIFVGMVDFPRGVREPYVYLCPAAGLLLILGAVLLIARKPVGRTVTIVACAAMVMVNLSTALISTSADWNPYGPLLLAGNVLIAAVFSSAVVAALILLSLSSTMRWLDTAPPALERAPE